MTHTLPSTHTWNSLDCVKNKWEAELEEIIPEVTWQKKI